MKLRKFLKDFCEDTIVQINEGPDADYQLYEGVIFGIPKKLLDCKIDSKKGICIYTNSCYETILKVSVINKIYYEE